MAIAEGTGGGGYKITKPKVVTPVGRGGSSGPRPTTNLGSTLRNLVQNMYPSLGPNTTRPDLSAYDPTNSILGARYSASPNTGMRNAALNARYSASPNQGMQNAALNARYSAPTGSQVQAMQNAALNARYSAPTGTLNALNNRIPSPPSSDPINPDPYGGEGNMGPNVQGGWSNLGQSLGWSQSEIARQMQQANNPYGSSGGGGGGGGGSSWGDGGGGGGGYGGGGGGANRWFWGLTLWRI